jgi:20S proteasome subunit beta 6
MLYGRRFFPYYAYVILAGIDRDGTGAVYSFDPVGSYERESCRAAGAAQSLVQPFLDNQVREEFRDDSLLMIFEA